MSTAFYCETLYLIKKHYLIKIIIIMQCCCTDMNCYIAYLIYDTVKNVIIIKKKKCLSLMNLFDYTCNKKSFDDKIGLSHK